MSCFMHYVSNDDHDILWLDDVMTAIKRPEQGKNIFFHETSCQDGIIRLNARYLLMKLSIENCETQSLLKCCIDEYVNLHKCSI